MPEEKKKKQIKKTKWQVKEIKRKVKYNKKEDKIKIVDENLNRQLYALFLYTMIVAVFFTAAGFITAYISIYAFVFFIAAFFYLLFRFKKVIVRKILLGW